MKLKRNLVSIVVALMTLLLLSSVSYAKSNEQIAQELLYGKWANASSGAIKYQFNENNLMIVHVGEVDPMGDSTFRVSLRRDDGIWTTNSVCYVSLETDRYVMYLVRRNDKGNEIKGEDWNVKYVKVY